MNRGFKETIDFILGRFGLKTRDCIGTVWADGDVSWRILNSMGYRVEMGIKNPDYDYIIMSKGKSTIQNILTALTKIKVGCIIVFRVDGNRELSDFLWPLNKLNSGLNFYVHGYGDGKILGVLFKGR